MKDVCPSCGRPLGPKIRVNGYVRQRIVDILCNYPDGIDSFVLADMVYANTTDPPKNWRKTIQITIHMLRKELRKRGWTIKSALGRGSYYQLVPMESVSECVLVQHKNVPAPVGG